MKKSLTLLLLGGALIFASPASAQKKGVEFKLPERQMTAEQQKEAEAAKATFNKRMGNAGSFRSERNQRAVMRPAEQRNFSAEFANPSAKIEKKAPLKATDEVYNVPQEFKFLTNAAFNLFTVIDANGDGKKWQRYGTYARLSYSSTLQSDDWLITPGLNLDPSKFYKVKIKYSGSGFNERIEVKYGTAPTVEGMTETILEPTEISTASSVVYEPEVLIRPSEAGVYYIGVHGISDPDQYYLAVHSISIVDGPATTTPAAATDLTVTPDPTGALNATISCTAPTTNIVGEPLTSLVGAKVYRGAEEVVDLSYHVIAGEPFTFVDDEFTAGGMYSYSVVFYNEDGEGAGATAEAWVGLDSPTAVTHPVLSEDGKNLTMTWETPEPVHGGAFFPEDLLYGINIPDLNEMYYQYYGIIYYTPNLDDGLVDVVQGKNTWTVPFDSNVGEQGDLQFAVFVQNDAGYGWDTSEACLSNSLLVGAPYALPYRETFSAGMPDNYAHFDSDGITSYYAGYYAAEGQDGSPCLEFVAQYDLLGVSSGKISLAGAANPTLVYKSRNVDPAAFPGMFQVLAITPDGQTSQLQIKDFTTDAIESDWTLNVIDLSPLKSEKYIQIKFQYMVLDDATGEYHAYDVDDINVLDYYNTNVRVALETSDEVARGGVGSAVVTITNVGEETVNDFRVKLTVGDDEIVDYTIVEKIEPFESKQYMYDFEISNIEQNDKVSAKVEVTVANDGDTSDNVAASIIDITASTVNPVQNLAVNEIESGRALTWEAPAIPEPGYRTYVETFDNGSLNDFTSIDANGDGYGWSAQNVGDGYDGAVSYSWISGVGAVTPDNWLVTPKVQLSGDFKFHAINANPDYGNEIIQVYVSTQDGTDVSTFEAISDVLEPDGVPGTDYSFDLSSYEGAEGWVAIRHFGTYDMYFVYVDDVEYMKFQEGGRPVAKYNIYRNGFILGETTSEAFVDSDALEPGEYTYQVTAVYDDGTESAPVATIYVFSDPDGIATVINNGQPVDVYTLDGVKVRQNVTTLGGLNKGVYVINGKKVTIK